MKRDAHGSPLRKFRIVTPAPGGRPAGGMGPVWAVIALIIALEVVVTVLFFRIWVKPPPAAETLLQPPPPIVPGPAPGAGGPAPGAAGQ